MVKFVVQKVNKPGVNFCCSGAIVLFLYYDIEQVEE